ncbi:MAG: hypothetical protein ACI8W3_001650, partial [Myxococcota bacterium]
THCVVPRLATFNRSSHNCSDTSADVARKLSIVPGDRI